MARGYRLGRRTASVDRTSAAILDAARALVAAGPASAVSVGAVARRAGVSRITIYNRFGSKEELLRAIVPRPPPEGTHPPPATDPREAVRQILVEACARWASDPALYRNLPSAGASAGREVEHQLVERLAAADALRPGCSTKEAEDVLAALGTFAVFDRLYKDGRRTPAAVAEILTRLASGILAYDP
ncbi:MAG: TetR/AcrR family transcriptional regulator [Chloroflexi bacterium]|nr:MAG: TetR/AcrR family transcriptional regulator [Chloroflexota bacterium]TMD72939.1 MAG: TetR/AcrR family transcriptional regulator [Chloroflexota bacterium]